MGNRSLLLLRHGTATGEGTLSEVGREEASFAADGLCAYLELPSNFMPKADGKPAAVKLLHSGKERAAQTASIVQAALVKAGCTVECVEAADALAPKAEAAAAVGLISASAAPLTVLVGHLPHLNVTCETLGIGVSDESFAPAGGVLLESNDNSGGWALSHHVLPLSAKKDWWIHGASSYTPSDGRDGTNGFHRVASFS